MVTDIVHGLSFDIECYNQIISKDYLNQIIEPTEEVERNTNYLLDATAKYEKKATFFFLGNVARKYPKLVKRVIDEGHELGVHGDSHLYIHQLDRKKFTQELGQAIDSIEQAGGAKVVGHRAPAFSINQDNLWALDVLAEAGLVYDSSVFPFQGRRYGINDWPLEPTQLESGLWEIPLSINHTPLGKFPCLGGGYFRHFPYAYTKYSVRKLEQAKRNGVTYFHPHEFEPTSAQIPLDAGKILGKKALLKLGVSNTLQSRGRKSMRAKLERFMGDFNTKPLGELLPQVQ